MKGVIYYELLDAGAIVTADRYSQQLNRLNEELNKKGHLLGKETEVILLHDNARPHVARITQNAILNLGSCAAPGVFVRLSPI